MGWWYGKNYGSILTYFALNRAIGKLGYSIVMVHEPLGYNGYRVKWPDDILSLQFARRMEYDYTSQQHYSTLDDLNNIIDTFVVGSDQLWNPLVGRVNDDLFLDFVRPEHRRIAYGTSFGNRGAAKFKDDFIEKHRKNLSRFDAISVREDYAVDTASTVFGVDAVQVVDPVFLLPRDDYHALSMRSKVTLPEKYLAIFFLDPTPEKRDVALAVADKLNLGKIVVIPNPDGGRKKYGDLFAGSQFETIPEDAPESFLYTYGSADYVITDSFHGTAFAVIFEKPFSVIYNTRRGADRFKSLMTSLGFKDTRRIYETDDRKKIGANPNVSFEIDYKSANAFIKIQQERSMAWLKSALDGTIERSGVGELIKTSYEQIKAKVAPNANDNAALPPFTANNDAWKIESSKSTTTLSVSPGGSIRGNQVWCDLPFELASGEAYRLTIKWKVKTSGKSVNLHVRKSQTGQFRMIGSITVDNRFGVMRTDTTDFLINEEGFDQFMLGAVHFSGIQGGAEIASVTVSEIPLSAVRTGKKKQNHAAVALQLAMDDHERFVSAHAKSVASQAPGGARARIMFHAHAIEKGLSRSNFRGGFGKVAVPSLAKEMNSWMASGRDPSDMFFRSGASVMNAYFARHRDVRVDVSQFRALFSQPVAKIIDEATENDGGVLGASLEREKKISINPENRFLDVVYGRRSVRDFIPKPVADEDIEHAVRIAMQAPSVCNRQAVRVHRFQNKAAIKAALDIQGGFGGYDMPPKLLLVTSDLNSFLFAAERNQAYVDGGLFMMALLLGLQHVGLGSCSLNTAMNTERAEKIRKILDIPENEVFISFVAVGHYDPDVLTPKSKRIDSNEVLVLHDKIA
jgi:nitroreductase